MADGSVLAWVLVAGSIVTSLLTLYAMARVWSKAFWRPRVQAPEGNLADAAPSGLIEESTDVLFDDRVDPGRMPRLMLAPTVALLAVGLSLTAFAGPVLGIAARSADELSDRGRYLETVLGTPDSWRAGGDR